MLFLHEIHEVIGGKMDAFEHALREQWVPLMERDGDAKLLWYWHHTHGTGPSYQAITIAAIRDWEAWGRLVERSRHDDRWREWYATVWQYRRELISKLLLSTAWSPVQDVDFSTVGSAASPE